jgi:uncharacterized membrane protein (DUF4010 family)
MDEIELFQRLSVALAIGLLIGLERGWQQRESPEGERTAGFRTFALSGLLGGVAGLLAYAHKDGGLIALALMFAAYAAIIATYRYRENIAEDNFGATTVIASMLTFALGAYAVLGDVKVAGAAGAATAGLLALKDILHGWLKRISWPELRSALVLLAMTFILLPFLPSEPVDPFGVIKPFEIWLLTVMIAAISFAGYIAIKLVGDTYGVAIAGVAGGLASSTALTVNMANLAKEHPEQSAHLAAGAVLAGATMFARVIAVIAVINVSLVKFVAWPLGAAFLAMLAGAAFLLWGWKNPEHEKNALALRNPFEIRSVLAFAVLLTVISALTKLATAYAGDAGAYILAAVSGIADVDAITLSMARPDGGTSSPFVATVAILIAVSVNTISKAVMAWGIGGRGIGWRLMAVSAFAIAAGAAAIFVSAMFVG